MAQKVTWTPRSVAHINRIHDYIAEDSAIYANRFIKDLVLHTEKLLQNHPQSGRLVPEFGNTPLKALREIIFKGYRIIYHPDTLYILSVINGRMDMAKNF